MSKASGTLISTNEATYIDPRLMPGYSGFCPKIRFDYGQTYGAQTAKYFQDYRSKTLRTSRSPYYCDGSYPAFYNSYPEVYLSNLNRGRNRYLDRVHFELYNVDFDRNTELKKFDSLVQRHRQYYKDRTDTVHPTRYFNIADSPARRIQSRYLF